MGNTSPPEPSLLFIGSLFSSREILNSVSVILREKFNGVLFHSENINWDYTDYYNEELGTPIQKRFIFFDSLFDPSLLADTKIITNDIENLFLKNNRRKINLDPGYLSLSKVVLASTKNYSHRIYLGKGIYAEVTLIYKNGKFIPLPYTYPDYKSKEYLRIFLEAREYVKRFR